jgi:hypothetical protein
MLNQIIKSTSQFEHLKGLEVMARQMKILIRGLRFLLIIFDSQLRYHRGNSFGRDY